ncbi:MAG: AmmeMemoRadiSam system protein B [Anaerolineae bacterium]
MADYSVRPPICADDRWYPASPEALHREVNGYIESAPALDLAGEVVGLVAPHAGYFFSGHVAGAGYRQIQGRHYDTVVLIGPDHRGLASGGLALPDYDAWHTPLGDVAVDRDVIAALDQRLSLRRIKRDSEHSLEVQLPFLQATLGDFKLAPIIMGDPSPAACRELGLAVAEVVRDRQALLVASTDLSHYYPDEHARRLDEHTLKYVLNFDPEGLAKALSRNEAHACGGSPVAAVMIAARELGANQAQLVRYATSGDVWEDRSQVVGYAAVALVRSQSAENQQAEVGR